MFTNYSQHDSGRACPQCSDTILMLILKGEASAYKFWFQCSDEDCGFETHTMWGPSPSMDDFDAQAQERFEREFGGRVPELAEDYRVGEKAEELAIEKAKEYSL